MSLFKYCLYMYTKDNNKEAIMVRFFVIYCEIGSPKFGLMQHIIP